MAKGKKTGGRTKGTPNKATVEAKTACSQLVDNPEYRTKLATRLRAGTLALAVEVYVVALCERGSPSTG